MVEVEAQRGELWAVRAKDMAADTIVQRGAVLARTRAVLEQSSAPTQAQQSGIYELTLVMISPQVS